MTRAEAWESFLSYEGDLSIRVLYMPEDMLNGDRFSCTYQGPLPTGVKPGGGTGPTPEAAICAALGATLDDDTGDAGLREKLVEFAERVDSAKREAAEVVKRAEGTDRERWDWRREALELVELWLRPLLEEADHAE